MTAATVDERAPLPGPAWPPSAPPTSFPLADRRPVVLADDPCEAGFSGADPEYAGIYLHARYFDPKLGTFLSPDPIGVEGGLNQYGYALGNPVNGTDRSGLLLDAGLWCFQIVVADHWTTICLPTTGGGGGGTTSGGSTGSNGDGGRGVCTGTCPAPTPAPAPAPPPPPPPPPPPLSKEKGSKTTVVGVEATAIVFAGAQCSVGAYFTDDTGDFGLVTSLGPGAGWDVSVEGFAGSQSTESLRGESLNINFSPGALAVAGGSLSLDPGTQEVTGGSASAGVSPLPNGASITRTSSYVLSIPQAPDNAARSATAIGQKAMSYLNPRPCGW